MRTQSISLYENKMYRTKKYVPSFKSDISFDIGGSQREGSCKIDYESSDGQKIFHTDNTTVNDLGKMRFEGPDDFINHIIKKIKKVQRECRGIVKDMGYGKEENAIRNVAIFLPSYTSNNFAFYLPNHRNLDDRPLKDLNFQNFKERLIGSNIDVAPDIKFKVMQDALGTGLAMTKRLYDNGLLSLGSYYTAAITGGGCGIANIEVPDNDKVIIKSTGSSYLSQTMKLEKVSRAGASVPAFIENFCRAMGMNDEMTADIKACQKAEFTTQEQCKLPKNDKTKKLADLLEETKKFNVKSDEDTISIRVKDEYKKAFKEARQSAIDKYCLALARLAIIKKNEGSNGMIVTGKFARVVDEVAKNIHDKGIAQWTMQHLTQSFNSYELDKMQQGAYHFEIMCDSRFFIDNNTECGKLAHLADFVNPIRGNWLKVLFSDLAKLK